MMTGMCVGALPYTRGEQQTSAQQRRCRCVGRHSGMYGPHAMVHTRIGLRVASSGSASVALLEAGFDGVRPWHPQAPIWQHRQHSARRQTETAFGRH